MMKLDKLYSKKDTKQNTSIVFIDLFCPIETTLKIMAINMKQTKCVQSTRNEKGSNLCSTIGIFLAYSMHFLYLKMKTKREIELNIFSTFKSNTCGTKYHLCSFSILFFNYYYSTC